MKNRYRAAARPMPEIKPLAKLASLPQVVPIGERNFDVLVLFAPVFRIERDEHELWSSPFFPERERISRSESRRCSSATDSCPAAARRQPQARASANLISSGAVGSRSTNYTAEVAVLVPPLARRAGRMHSNSTVSLRLFYERTYGSVSEGSLSPAQGAEQQSLQHQYARLHYR